eukprot:12595635-Alexandrium_andersonii.AAC.1
MSASLVGSEMCIRDRHSDPRAIIDARVSARGCRRCGLETYARHLTSGMCNCYLAVLQLLI